jgi:transposase InsO family protein
MLMQQHGIEARGKRKFIATTDSNHGLPVAKNLLNREFEPSEPNAVWTSDITYIATDEGWLYWPSPSTCSAVRSWVGRCSSTCDGSW